MKSFPNSSLLYGPRKKRLRYQERPCSSSCHGKSHDRVVMKMRRRIGFATTTLALFFTVGKETGVFSVTPVDGPSRAGYDGLDLRDQSSRRKGCCRWKRESNHFAYPVTILGKGRKEFSSWDDTARVRFTRSVF